MNGLRAHIIDLFNRHRLSLSDEKLLQEEIALMLSHDGLPFRREYRLAAGDIVDFLVLYQTEPPLAGVAFGIIDPKRGVQTVTSDESRIKALAKMYLERQP